MLRCLAAILFYHRSHVLTSVLSRATLRHFCFRERKESMAWKGYWSLETLRSQIHSFPDHALLGLHGFDDLITQTGDHMKVTTQSCAPHQRLASAHVRWVCTKGLSGKDGSPPSRHYQHQVLTSLFEGWGSQDWKDKDFYLSTLGVMHTQTWNEK